MDRDPIQRQSRFAPAQARAQAFSIFAPARVDNSLAEGLQGLAEVAGDAAAHLDQKELDEAEDDFEQGLIQGLINDGTEIREGRMDPGESPYFQRGVERGRMRAAALEIGMRLTERRQRAIADGERIPLGSDEYEAWRDQNLAEIQQELGIDPSALERGVFREYAAGIHQVRQNDAQRQGAYRSDILMEDAYVAADVEFRSIWENSENMQDAVSQASALIESRRATGLDPARLRQMSVQSVQSQAVRETNPQILRDYIEAATDQNPPMITQQQELSMLEQINTLENRRQADINAARVAAERAEEERLDREMDVINTLLFENPHAFLPEQFIGDHELTERYYRLQAAHISALSNRVDPVSSALHVDAALALAAVDGRARESRQNLTRAFERGEVRPEDYRSAMSRIGTLEAEPGLYTHSVVANGRRRLVPGESVFNMLNDAERRVHNERIRTYDFLVLEYVGEWYADNPDAGRITTRELTRLVGEVTDRVEELSPETNEASAASLRRERGEARSQNEDQSQGITLPQPGQQ